MSFWVRFLHVTILSLISTVALSHSSRDMLLDFLKGQEQEATPAPTKDGQAILLGQLLRKFLEDNFRQLYYELYLINRTVSNINSSLSGMNLETTELYSNLEANLTDFTISMSNMTNDTYASVKELILEIKEIKEAMGEINTLKNITSDIKRFKDVVMSDMKKQTKSLSRLIRTSYSIAVRVAEMYQVSVRRKGCADLLKLGDNESGVHSISPQRANESPTVDVYCDMETDGGGWTVIQRRGVGNLSKDERPYFNRNWIEYEQGFGNASTGDYWLGLESIRSLTRNCAHELLINLTDWEDQNRFAHYDKFHVSSKLDRYRLYVQGHSGNVDDSLLYHNGKQFSTFDEDNDDNRSPTSPSCAKMYGGGWWFGDCLKSNLNGNYPEDDSKGRVDKLKGIRWNSWTGMKHSLKTTEMKIRPINDC